MQKVSLIVPCYNEEESIVILYDAIKDVEKGLRDRYTFEMVMVNDGSSDKTLEILKDLAEKDNEVKYISFSRNFGKEAAMYAGFCNSTGDLVAVMDADMQDPPSLLPEMLSIIESGEYDSVATRRVSRKGEPVIRSFFARRFYKLINRISDTDLVDGARDFRLMKRQMVDVIIEMDEYNRFSKGIFGWIGFRTYWLPFENTERVAGKTKWSFFGLFRYAIDGIINFSQAPLTIAAWTGILFTILSMIAVIFVFVRRLMFGDPVAGWASTACIILFVSGVQLFCLGIIGEYMSKNYLETKKRPHYIIAETNDEEAKLVK